MKTPCKDFYTAFTNIIFLPPEFIHEKTSLLFPLDGHSSNHQPPSDPALCVLFPLTNSRHVFFHPINLRPGLPAGLPPATSNLRVLTLIYSLHLLCTRSNCLSLASPASTPKHVAMPPPFYLTAPLSTVLLSLSASSSFFELPLAAVVGHASIDQTCYWKSKD